MKIIFTKMLHGCIIVALLTMAAIGFISCGEKSSLSEISIVPANPGMAIGTTRQLTGYGVLSSGLVFLESYLAWTSSNPDVATVSSTGLVTAGSTTGTTTITATETDSHTNVSGTTLVTVCTVSSIALTPVNPRMAMNTLHQFAAIATLASNASFTQNVTSYMTWTTVPADSAVATVGAAGLVTTGSTTGSVTIQATENDLIAAGAAPIIAETVLTVTGSALSSIAVAGTAGMTIESTQQLIATGTYADATTDDVTPHVTWSSSDTTVANVDQTGMVTTYSTPGTVTLTAKDPITLLYGSIAITVN